MRKTETQRLAAAGLLTAIGVVLPILMRLMAPLQVLAMIVPGGGQLGAILLPMHIPVLLCGFICGWKYGLICGLIVPFLTHLFNGGLPPIPTAVSMAFELATYGAISGLMYKKKMPVFISLVAAMLAGRVAMGVANVVIYGMQGSAYGIKIYLMASFVTAWPGIVLQLVLIPVILKALKRNRLMVEQM